jgi:hypothetical protein
MSFKEFVPSAQAGSTSSSHDSSMSPTLGKYLERNVEPIPYWSPATRRGEENSEEYSNITAIVESSSANQLAISATEFVPSGVSAGAGMLRMQSVNGLNLQAAAWVPPAANANVNAALPDQQQQQQQQGDGGEAYIESQGLDNEGEIEAMVEVSEAHMYSPTCSTAYVENVTAFLILNYWSSSARHIIVDSVKRCIIFRDT